MAVAYEQFFLQVLKKPYVLFHGMIFLLNYIKRLMQKEKSTNKEKDNKKVIPTNADLEGNDKYPGEEKGKAEKVTNKDLKGKKVDADPELESDKPVK